MDINTYKNIIGNRESIYFLRQVLVITGLFTAGLIPSGILRRKVPGYREMLLAYPLGLAVFGVSGFLLLIPGISFSVISVLLFYILLTAGLFLFTRSKPFTGSKGDVIRLAAGYITVIILAAISCSGFMHQIVTNDSVYYYSMYPSILAHDGLITASLDKYLTDVGQTTAVIQCLPFFFGFDESFGIQHFLNFNFILLFFMSLQETLCKPNTRRRFGITAALLGTVLLVSSEPYVVLSKWILSNGYFMVYLYLVFYLVFHETGKDGEDKYMDLCILFMSAFLIMSRMEGGVIVFVLSLALSVLPVRKEKLLLYFGLPLFVMEIGYYGMIYLKIGVDPLYSFLDIKTALLMAGMTAGLLIYIIFVRDRVPQSLVPVMLLLLLVLGNAGLLILNNERYITNLKAFILNIRQGNGWGSFIIIIVIYCALFIHELVKNRCRNLRVPVFLPAALVPAIIAVCFARGGVLAVRTSDSGNRVLMEIVPLLLFSVFYWFVPVLSGCGQEQDEEDRI